MRHFPTQEFPITGDLDRDIKNYMEYRKIPPYYQHLDDNIYVISRLRLSFGRTLTVHTLTDGVIEKVKHTRIENVPNEIPKFMRQPFLIEARHDKTLFGEPVNSVVTPSLSCRSPPALTPGSRRRRRRGGWPVPPARRCRGRVSPSSAYDEGRPPAPGASPCK